MTHPFAWLPSPYRWALLALLFAGTAILAIVLSRQGKLLKTPAAPAAIISYEFAWGRSRAEQIIKSWDSLKDTARRQLYTDFGFLIVYPLLFSLACAMLAESPYNELAAVGVFISWAVLASGPLDAIENFALLRMLDHGASDSLARLAGWSAGLKFMLVFSSLGYVVLQGLGTFVNKIRAA